MTPEQYVTQLKSLVEAGRFADVLELGQRHGEALLPHLSAIEFVYVASLMELADRVVEAQQGQTIAPVASPATLPSRPSS